MTRSCSRSPRKLVELGVLAVLVAAVSGCGDARHSLGGAERALNNVGYCNPDAAIDIIDNMEDGDGSLFLSHGRAGVWFSYNDGTNRDATEQTTQQPPTGAEHFPMENFSPPRDGSHYAARTHGAGYTKWGAGIGFDLLVQQQYDASHYAGLTFYMRRTNNDADTVDSSLRVTVPDVHTSPLGGICDPGGNGCYSDFGADLTLTDDWQRVTLPWHQLEQPGWTLAENKYPSIVTTAIYGIRFQASKAKPFDFWIDDIAFMCNE